MTVDRIANLPYYLPEKQKDNIMCFINSVSSGLGNGNYNICSENVYAKIMSYATKKAEKCVVEAHSYHMDIQFSLQGAEGIDIFAPDQLRAVQEYDVDQDVQLYDVVEDHPIASVLNREGYFCLIPAGVPHRPMKAVTNEGWVKKCVIKILSLEGV